MLCILAYNGILADKHGLFSVINAVITAKIAVLRLMGVTFGILLVDMMCYQRIKLQQLINMYMSRKTRPEIAERLLMSFHIQAYTLLAKKLS